jgi:serine/threonine-protein kinase
MSTRETISPQPSAADNSLGFGSASALSGVGKKVGNIRLIALLGEGGMGSVYAGFDDKLGRRVAVKVIRADRLRTGSRERLLREARILSQLDHPHICRVYDHLENEGCDYLVLEFIRGENLGEAIRKGIEPRLKLRIAEQVAEALAAAHARGIIHRDLGPSNIMLSDGRDVKVLDFGLARPAGAQEISTESGRAEGAEGGKGISASSGVITEFDTVMGTVTNMSPEQAINEDLTVASDLYSFGLLLQELFTDRPAYDLKLSYPALLKKAVYGETVPVTGLDPDLTRLINRLKSFAPEVRPTAAESARRLRWIRRKPTRRLRWLVTTLASVTLFLGGLKYTFDLQRERNLAVAARIEAEQVSKFLVEVFEVSDPGVAQGRDLTARQILEMGALKLETELPDQPLTRARLMTTIGEIYYRLNLFEDARNLAELGLEIHREHLPGGHPDLAASLALLGVVEYSLHHYEAARDHYLEALAIYDQPKVRDLAGRARVLGRLGHLNSQQGDLAQAETSLRQSLEIRENIFGTEASEIADSLDELARHLKVTGDLHQADALLKRSLKIRENALRPMHPDLFTTLNALAETYIVRERFSQASPYARRALDIGEEVFGIQGPDVAGSLYLVAVIGADAGQFVEAEAHFHRAVEIMENALGPAAFNVGALLDEYGRFQRDIGEQKKAEALLQRSGRIIENILGPDNILAASSPESLAILRMDQGRTAEAIHLFQQVEHIYRKAGNPDAQGLAKALHGLGIAHLAAGDLALAEIALGEAVALQQRATTQANIRLGAYLGTLARATDEQGRHGEAERLYRKAQATVRQWLVEVPESRRAMSVLASNLLGLGKIMARRGEDSGAKEHWLEALRILEPLTSSVPKVDYLDLHACTLLYLGRLEEARPKIDFLIASGWRRPRLLSLCKHLGLSYQI